MHHKKHIFPIFFIFMIYFNRLTPPYLGIISKRNINYIYFHLENINNISFDNEIFCMYKQYNHLIIIFLTYPNLRYC
jgi:hypothetical protein